MGKPLLFIILPLNILILDNLFVITYTLTIRLTFHHSLILVFALGIATLYLPASILCFVSGLLVYHNADRFLSDFIIFGIGITVVQTCRRSLLILTEQVLEVGIICVLSNTLYIYLLETLLLSYLYGDTYIILLVSGIPYQKQNFL